MKSKIGKIINWKGKEYAYLIDEEPAEFCDCCVFRKECAMVLSKELAYEESPMKICSDLSEEFNTNFANFILYETRR